MFRTVNHGRKLLRGIQPNFISYFFNQIRFLFLPLLVVMAALSEGRSLEKRQTQSGDRFFLFGQVMRSLGEYKSTTMVLYSPIGRITEIMYHSVHEIYQHFIKVREMILTNLERICFFLVQLFNTAVDEGGKFISRQVRYIISTHQWRMRL